MSTDDESYFIARAEAELELAQRSSHPHVVRAHYLLANSYLDRVYVPAANEAEAAAT